MIEARFKKEFSGPKGKSASYFGAWAHTLESEYIGENDSGWVVDGAICEDYYEWVNEFQARHPEKGLVWGDFEDVVYATSQEAYDDFIKHHPPSEWDYYDI